MATTTTDSSPIQGWLSGGRIESSQSCFAGLAKRVLAPTRNERETSLLQCSMRSSSNPRKSQPFSVRLSPAADLLVREEGLRLGRSRGAVVEELAEEAAKMRLFPGIGFRDMPRRAWVIGSGLDVWEVMELLSDYDGDETRLMRAHPMVKERHLRLARSYADRFPQEIDFTLAANSRPFEELLSLYPFLQSGR